MLNTLKWYQRPRYIIMFLVQRYTFYSYLVFSSIANFGLRVTFWTLHDFIYGMISCPLRVFAAKGILHKNVYCFKRRCHTAWCSWYKYASIMSTRCGLDYWLARKQQQSAKCLDKMHYQSRTNVFVCCVLDSTAIKVHLLWVWSQRLPLLYSLDLRLLHCAGSLLSFARVNIRTRLKDI